VPEIQRTKTIHENNLLFHNMARLQDEGFGAWFSNLDQQNVDPLASSAMEIDASLSQKTKPTQLVFGEPDALFSDPWGKERPLTPLDENVPQWFQRRKLALVPEDLHLARDVACDIPIITLDAEMDLGHQESPQVNSNTSSSLKRARSHVDIADRFARDTTFFDQLGSCGQVVNNLMRSPAVQSLLSRKRKVDSSEIDMDDIGTSWKRRNMMNGSCHFGNTLGREMALTSADFCSWNFGFDLHMTAGRC
jgi:hypothetical protein